MLCDLVCSHFLLKITTKLVTGRLPRRHTHKKKSNKHRYQFTCDVTLESTLFVNGKIITRFPKKKKKKKGKRKEGRCREGVGPP